jgi:AsmA protein
MKLIGKFLLGFVALCVAALAALLFLVDLNSFKPRIEAAAKQQGLVLELKGDLGWSLWPSLGIKVAQLRLASAASPDITLADLDQASFLVELMPLFAGQVHVQQLLVDGARINLQVDAEGKNNWQLPAAEPQDPAPSGRDLAADKALTNSANNGSGEASDEQALVLNIDKISIVNSALNYGDASSGQAISLDDIALNLVGVNTQGQPFMMELGGSLLITEPAAEPLRLKANLRQRVMLAADFTQLQLAEGELQLELSRKVSAALRIAYSATFSDLQGKLNYRGSLQFIELNARKWLAVFAVPLDTANSSALSDLSLTTEFSGDTNQLALDSLLVGVDKTQFKGAVALKDIAKGIYALQLAGDSMNVDDYLPLPVAEVEATAAAPVVADTPLPLELLRALNLNAQLSLTQAKLKNLQLNNIKFQLNAKRGLLEQKFSADAYQGAINFDAQMDARPAQAQVKFAGEVAHLELQPLLTAMELKAKVGLSGALQAKAKGGSSGASLNQLVDSMDANASFSAAQLRVSPINIEQQICKVVNVLQQAEPSAQNWNDYTEMRELTGAVKWQNQIINIETFKAGVKQLQIGSTGQINLATDKYDFALPFQLIEAQQTSADVHSCLGSLTSSYWLQRSISLLRCKGSFSGLDPLKDCGPDKKAMAQLTKDFAEFKLREKHGAKIDAAKQQLDDKKQAALNKLQEKIGGEGEVKKPKDLLNNFLKKKLGGDTSAAASSSAPATDSAEPQSAP